MGQEPEADEFHAIDKALALNDVVHAVFGEGDRFLDVCGFSPERMRQFYTCASRFIRDRHYQAAADAFLFLTTVDPGQFDYWVGLGLAEQHLQHYELALSAYCTAAVLDLDDPTPHLQAAECYLARRKLHKANVCLDLAIACSDGGKHRELTQKRVGQLRKRIEEVGS